MKIVGCLQNVWYYPHVPEERCRDYAYWYRAFCRCRSGQRLRKNLGEKIFGAMTWENASPQIGRKSSAKFPPDDAHIQGWIARHTPHMIIAFGQVAEEALVRLWPGNLIAAPHPASRLLTNNLLLGIGYIIAGQKAIDSLPSANNSPVRLALRQHRGRYDAEPLPYRGDI